MISDGEKRELKKIFDEFTEKARKISGLNFRQDTFLVYSKTEFVMYLTSEVDGITIHWGGKVFVNSADSENLSFHVTAFRDEDKIQLSQSFVVEWLNFPLEEAVKATAEFLDFFKVDHPICTKAFLETL